MSDSHADLVARVNSVRVSAEDLKRVADAIADLPSELRTREGLMHVAAQEFKPDGHKAFAVSERMAALVMLLSTNSIPPALFPFAEDGWFIVSDQLLAAAAEEPLLFRGGKPHFQPDSFLATFLARSGTRGRT